MALLKRSGALVLVLVGALAVTGVALIAIQGGGVAESESAGVGLSGISQPDADQLIKAVRGDPWVRAELEGTDNRVVQILDPIDGKSGVIVYLVDYTNRRALSISFSLDRSSIEGRRVENINVPDISPAEREMAANIALNDRLVRTKAGPGTELVVNSVTGSGGPDCADSRCLAVFLTPPDGNYERLVVAIVDLSTKAVTGILP